MQGPPSPRCANSFSPSHPSTRKAWHAKKKEEGNPSRGGLQGTGPELLGSWEDLPPAAQVVDHKVVHAVLQGYMPSLVLTVFQSNLPGVLHLLTRWEGRALSEQQVQHSASTKFFAVLVLNVFLGSVVTQSVFHQLENMLEHFSIKQLVIPPCRR
eukprot:5764323-Pyramimonas_sp.AAC.1